MILITGASGLLGASVVAFAAQRGLEVVGIYNRHSVHLGGARFAAADLTKPEEVERIFEEFRPSAVIHCAAETNVDWCEGHAAEARVLNVAASAAIAGVAARNAAHFLYVSTDSVFDGTRGDYAETDQPAPPNVYAQTKLEGEQAVLARHDSGAVARVNLYGWNVQKKQSLAEWIFEQLRSGKTVPGFTDVVFCPILANDLAEILLVMTEKRLAGIFHVVGSEAVSKYEFARRVARAFDFDPAKVVPTQIADAKLRATRPRNTTLNTEKICQVLDRSMPDVDSGLRRFAQMWRDGFVERIRGQLTGVRE